MQRPNVLILYTDQQRWDALAAAGNERIHTPNLDALAARGVVFDHAFCNCPVCMPSRMSMLSGRYPSAVGACCNGIEMPEDMPCLHNLLAPYGYHTGNIGKLHFKNHASAYRDHRDPHPTYGFDTLIHSDEPGCYDDAYIKWVAQQAPDQVDNCRVDTPPAWTGTPIHLHPRRTHEPYVFDGPEHLTHSAFVAEETVSFLARHQHEPFFCIAGFYAPHAPLNPPQRFVDLYDVDAMPLPHRNEDENLDDTSDAQWRKTVAYYYALVSHVDDQVGRILQALDRLGLRDNTIVVFTSDHGEYLGDHGRIGKSGPEDCSARVPLIVSYPQAFEPCGIRHELMEAVDIAPTLLDWCGVQAPPFLQGRSFRSLLEGGGYTPRASAFVEFRVPFGYGYKAVRTHEHLYVHETSGNERLFLLDDDRHALTDRSADPACRETLASMRLCLLERWFDVEKQIPQRTGQY